MALGNSDGSTSQMQSLDLPTDPDGLYARLEREASGHGSGLYAEMFTLVGDNLRENTRRRRKGPRSTRWRRDCLEWS